MFIVFISRQFEACGRYQAKGWVWRTQTTSMENLSDNSEPQIPPHEQKDQ